MKWILILGSAVNGLAFIGPFDEVEDAVDFGEKEVTGSWEVVEVAPPWPQAN